MENESGNAAQPQAFQAITSQEQFDAMIHDRIERAKNVVRNEYADYDDLKAAKAELDQLRESQMSDLEKATKRAEDAEKELADMRAHQKLVECANAAAEKYGVPASLLRGSNAKEIEAHAKAIAESFAPGKPVVGSDGGRAATPDTSKDWLREMFFTV